MTDTEIESEAIKAGGRWDGNRWAFEDADFHPFARALLAVERERWYAKCAGKRHEGCHYVATCGTVCNKCGQLA